METNKHAYLVMAHNDFYVLEKLLSLLDHEKNDIYIHIDKKVKNFDFNYYKTIVKKSNLYYTDRVKVYWGDFSQIETELILYKTAYERGGYVYYHLISGIDLPIQTQDYIHAFFEKHKGNEFIECSEGDMIPEWKKRIFYMNLFTKYLRPDFNPVVFRLIYHIRKLFLLIQEISHLQYRKEDEYFQYRVGANWASLSHDFVGFLLSQEYDIVKRYKYTVMADEIYKQTVFYNSKFKNNSHAYMRTIDWERGCPYVWQDGDLEELIQSEGLFARKFSGKYQKVVNGIVEYYR